MALDSVQCQAGHIWHNENESCPICDGPAIIGRRLTNAGAELAIMSPSRDPVPYVSSLADILKRWDTTGLVPLEVTEADFMQTITVRHNARTGAAQVQYEKLDGVQTMMILLESVRAVWRDTFKSEVRPILNSGHAKVCIQLVDDTLSVSAGMTGPNQRPGVPPTVDAVVAGGMALAAALLIAERADAGGWDPLAVLLQGIEFYNMKTGGQEGGPPQPQKASDENGNG